MSIRVRASAISAFWTAQPNSNNVNSDTVNNNYYDDIIMTIIKVQYLNDHTRFNKIMLAYIVFKFAIV